LPDPFFAVVIAIAFFFFPIVLSLLIGDATIRADLLYPDHFFQFDHDLYFR